MRKIIALFFGLNSSLSFALTADNHALGHGELLRVIIGLLVVLMIILLLSWILKRLNNTNLTNSQGFKSLAAMTFGSKEKVMLIQVGERYLLIGITAGSINLLCDFGEQLPQGFDGEPRSTFAALLKSASGKS